MSAHRRHATGLLMCQRRRFWSACPGVAPSATFVMPTYSRKVPSTVLNVSKYTWYKTPIARYVGAKGLQGTHDEYEPELLWVENR